MPTELRWIASLPANALHAAQSVVNRRQFADADLMAAIDAPVQELATAIEATGIEIQLALPQLIALSGGIPEPRSLAEVALTKLIPAQAATASSNAVGMAIRDLIAAYKRQLPDMIEELELRSKPLRDQWDARGPGLLAMLRRLVGSELIVERADVILVHPILGGFGQSFLQNNTVLLEAVLADPIPQLPEVVRLAWHIAPLNFDLAVYHEELSNSLSTSGQPLTRDQLADLAALAMLPAVLAAAQEVDLANCNAASITLALEKWRLAPDSNNSILPDTLFDWWQTYMNSRPKWAVALAGLREMLRTCWPKPINQHANI